LKKTSRAPRPRALPTGPTRPTTPAR
jgi:hypothetical protein